MKKNSLRLFFSILLISLFFGSATLVHANADSIIIKDDGSIVLTIESPVLGESTDKQKNEQKPPTPTKTVPLVSPSQPATVTVNPTSSTKVTVTITEPPKTTKPSQNAPTKNAPSTSPQTGGGGGGVGGAPGRVIRTQQVDRVVVEGRDNNVVLSISPTSQKTLRIDEGPIQASINLPLQIDSTTHALTATSSEGSNVKLLLPKIVVENLANEGLVSQTALTPLGTTPASVPKPQVSLSQQGGDVIYTVKQERKLFNVIPLPPSIVTVSNLTGKTTAPIYSRIFGLIFR